MAITNHLAVRKTHVILMKKAELNKYLDKGCSPGAAKRRLATVLP